MDLQKSFKNALDILQLKEPAMQAVAADPEATKVAWMAVGLGALATGLGLSFFPVHMGMVVYRPDLTWVLQHTIGEALGMMGGLYAGGFIAEKAFHSKLSMLGFVRVMGHAALLGVVSLIPFLGILSVWELVVWWMVCTKLGKMQTEATVIFLVILLLVAGFLSSVGAALAGGSSWGGSWMMGY